MIADFLLPESTRLVHSLLKSIKRGTEFLDKTLGFFFPGSVVGNISPSGFLRSTIDNLADMGRMARQPEDCSYEPNMGRMARQQA